MRSDKRIFYKIIKRSMKIIFVSNRYKRGEPERGPNYGYHNFYDALLKMNNFGNQVVFFGVDEALMSSGENQEKVKNKLFQMILQEKPDLVFFLEGELSRETLKGMKEVAERVGAKTLWWVSDDSWMFDAVSKKIVPYFHWVVTADSKSFTKYRKIGFRNIIHSQYACNHFCYKAQNLPKIYDVTFIGQPHSVRGKMVKGLRKEGINVKCWGFGWPAGVLPQKEMPKVFSQSKINLNFNMSSGSVWKKFGSIFLKHRGERNSRKLMINNPKNWPDNFRSFLGALRPQIHCRTFEVPGCGGFLLTDYADNLSDYYQDGKELVIFDGFRDLVKKIKYYLGKDQEREVIARAGYERTLKEHTYEKRFNEIFKIMGLIG